LVPILVDGDQFIADSTQILKHIDARLPEQHRLYPGDATHRSEVEGLEDEFDDVLGPAVRRAVYGVLLNDPPTFAQVLSAGTSPQEKPLALAMMPLIRQGIRRGLKVYPDRCARSLERVRSICTSVDQRLQDGRRFLTGDRFTAADLTFASLMGPLLLPPGYGGPMLAHLPRIAALDALAAPFRQAASGHYVSRLYAEERGRQVP
jgi:glutathione S-transferase